VKRPWYRRLAATRVDHAELPCPNAAGQREAVTAECLIADAREWRVPSAGQDEMAAGDYGDVGQ
jgi:hypothetical protein